MMRMDLKRRNQSPLRQTKQMNHHRTRITIHLWQWYQQLIKMAHYIMNKRLSIKSLKLLQQRIKLNHLELGHTMKTKIFLKNQDMEQILYSMLTLSHLTKVCLTLDSWWLILLRNIKRCIWEKINSISCLKRTYFRIEKQSKRSSRLKKIGEKLQNMKETGR